MFDPAVRLHGEVGRGPAGGRQHRHHPPSRTISKPWPRQGTTRSGPHRGDPDRDRHSDSSPPSGEPAPGSADTDGTWRAIATPGRHRVDSWSYRRHARGSSPGRSQIDGGRSRVGSGPDEGERQAGPSPGYRPSTRADHRRSGPGGHCFSPPPDHRRELLHGVRYDEFGQTQSLSCGPSRAPSGSSTPSTRSTSWRVQRHRVRVARPGRPLGRESPA